MPGHKGQSFLGAEPWDITEIDGADVLYSADGIIRESEDIASSLFHTAHSFYSAEGSTLAIKAMLTLAAQHSESADRPLILAARNAHKAFLYGAALLDLDVQWMYHEPFTHLCRCEITPGLLRSCLQNAGRKPCAVYITSPDYLGRIADIRALSEVCREHDVPLLVDNAHGAYLGFLEPSLHPIALGAAACCDSAHKTLPVLTGGAYLHISPRAPASFTEHAREALSLFASTSPSYLILQSLDLCNHYLSDGYTDKLSKCVRKTEAVKERLSRMGFRPEESEPLKIVLHASKYGYTGDTLCAHLKVFSVVPEFYDRDYLVLMITPENKDRDFERLLRAFEHISPKHPLPQIAQLPQKAEMLLSVREAMLAPREILSVEEAEGRICASPSVSCPPAVPIVMSGERISQNAVRLFRLYGVETVCVVKVRATPT